MFRLNLLCFSIGCFGVWQAWFNISLRHVQLDAIAIVGGTCYSEGHDAMCSDDLDSLETDCDAMHYACECRFKEYQEDEFTDWQAAYNDGDDEYGCDTMWLSEYYEYEVRCIPGTTVSVDLDPNFEECDEDQDGEYESKNNLGEDAVYHVCCKLQECKSKCKAVTSGPYYCQGPHGPK